MKTQTLSAMLLALLALTMIACGGGGSDPESLLSGASDAMSSGEYDAATKKLDQAIDALGTDGDAALLTKAKVNRALCRIHVGSGDEGVKEFLALDGTTWKDYKRVGEVLSDEDYNVEAIELLDKGAKAFPDHKDDLVAVITSIQEKDLSSEATDKLKKLGYVK